MTVDSALKFVPGDLVTLTRSGAPGVVLWNEDLRTIACDVLPGEALLVIASSAELAFEGQHEGTYFLLLSPSSARLGWKRFDFLELAHRARAG